MVGVEILRVEGGTKVGAQGVAPCVLCGCCRVLVSQGRFERGTRAVRLLAVSKIITSDLRRPIAETTVILSGSLGPAWCSALSQMARAIAEVHTGAGECEGEGRQHKMRQHGIGSRALSRALRRASRGSGSCAKGREDGQERGENPKDANPFFADPTPTPASLYPALLPIWQCTIYVDTALHCDVEGDG